MGALFVQYVTIGNEKKERWEVFIFHSCAIVIYLERRIK